MRAHGIALLKYIGFFPTHLLQLLNYAHGTGLGGNTIGYVVSGCFEDAYNFRADLKRVHLPVIWAVAGSFLLGIFLLMAPVMLFLRHPGIREFSQKTFSYAYEHYGLFWGLSTTLCFCTIALLYFNAKTLALVGASSGPYQYVFPAAIVFIGCACAVVAIYFGVNLRIAIPSVYLFPVSLFCCCSKRRARTMITSVVLWFDFTAIQFACHHGFVIILALPVAPIAIAANVLLLLLVPTCFVHIIALVFTICASTCTPKRFRPARSCQFIFRALILIPLLLAVVCLCAVFAFIGRYVPTEQKGFFTTLWSLISSVILGVLSFGLKTFISSWLKAPMDDQEMTESAVYERLE